MSKPRDNSPIVTGKADVDAFLAKVTSTPRPAGQSARGRLLFGMDATASREPTWDRACHVQSEMFRATSSLGGLSVQLCFYRGFNEFYKSQWLSDAPALLRAMSKVRCVGGLTQIERVLRHAVAEHRATPLKAVVFIGDVVEEQPDAVCDAAGQLGVLGVPVFVFQEGGEPSSRRALEQVARLSHGAYCAFDLSSPDTLRDLLRAVATYASGGRAALDLLEQRSGGDTPRLGHQLR